MSPEDSDQISRGRRRWRTVRCSGLLSGSNREDDVIAFGGHKVRMSMVQIQHHTCDQRIGAVLRGTDAKHSVLVDRYIPRVVRAGCIGKVEQYPLRIFSGLNGRLDGSAESDLDEQVGTIARRRHALYRCGRGILRSRDARQREQHDS